jgi:hypothetical protein
MAKPRQPHSYPPAASGPEESRQIISNRLSREGLTNLDQDARHWTPEKQHQWEENLRLLHVARVRVQFKWPWGAGAEFLYRELIRALGLEQSEDVLVRLAKSKPGRKEQRELYLKILSLKNEGKTARQIQAQLEHSDRRISLEGVESYLKTRRKKKQP